MSLEFRQGRQKDVGSVLKRADSLNDPFAITAILDPDRLGKCDTFFVAIDGSETIGFCGLRVENTRRPELAALYILPCYRHQGIGRRLFLLAIDHMIVHGKPTVYCEVTTVGMRRCVERLNVERANQIKIEMNYTGEYEVIEEYYGLLAECRTAEDTEGRGPRPPLDSPARFPRETRPSSEP